MTETLSLAECPVGLFLCSTSLCVKTEYSGEDGRIDAYVVASGEFFWGGASTPERQRLVQVTPVHSNQGRIGDDIIPDEVADFLGDVADEVERAAMLHPGPNPNLAALTEEVGEVAEALLQARQSYLRFGTVMPADWDAIRMEAVQVAAMAFRIVFEGDPSLSVVPE